MAIADISGGDLNAALSRSSQPNSITKITQTEVITIIDPGKCLTHLKMNTSITIRLQLPRKWPTQIDRKCQICNTQAPVQHLQCRGNLVAVIVQCKQLAIFIFLNANHEIWHCFSYYTYSALIGSASITGTYRLWWLKSTNWDLFWYITVHNTIMVCNLSLHFCFGNI